MDATESRAVATTRLAQAMEQDSPNVWWRCDVSGCQFQVPSSTKHRALKKCAHKNVHARPVTPKKLRKSHQKRPSSVATSFIKRATSEQTLQTRCSVEDRSTRDSAMNTVQLERRPLRALVGAEDGNVSVWDIDHGEC